MRGDDKLILVIRLTKEQNLALVSRYPTELIRAGIEQGVQGIADTIIEEDKTRGLSQREINESEKDGKS